MANATVHDLVWVTMCAALVMLMQGGFCLLESGLSRSKNSINVAIKNLVDFCLAGAVFRAVGFGVMFGATASGWFGQSHFAVARGDDPALLAFFLFQLVFCGTATTIISGAVAERMRFTGYALVSFVVAATFYPLFGHWAWGGMLQSESAGWLASRGFVDFAGSTVVHSLGGWLTLAAILVIGPRTGRFDRETPFRVSNVPMAVLGVILL